VIGAQLPSLPMRADGSRARKLDSLCCDSSPSQLTRISEFSGHLGSAVHSPDLGRRGHFLFNGSDIRAGSLNFDTSPELGGNERRVGANAFHGNNHGASNVQGLGKGFQGG